MALTLTLAQLREEVGLALDAPIGDGYISASIIDRWINRAIQEYAACRAQYGNIDAKRTTIVGSTSTTPGTDGFPANEVLTLPADFTALESLSYMNSGVRYLLKPMAESDRDTWWDYPITNLGPPEYYALLDATPSLAARVRVWPPIQSAYTFELVYRPQVTALAVDGDTWEYLPGTADYVICQVAMWQAAREGVQESAQFSVFQQRYQAALAALQRMSSRSGGATAMRNTRSRPRIGRGGILW